MSQEWKLVPVVPTKEMMLNGSACQHHDHDDLSCIQRDMRRGIWDKMIAAAPVPPAGGDQEVRRIVTEALLGMISAVVSATPPPNAPLPDFIQAPVDRAVTRIGEHVIRLQAENAALQQRLNVADQLVDDLETRAAELATAAGAVKACLELPDGRRAGWEARCLDLLRTVLPILHAPRELHRLQG